MGVNAQSSVPAENFEFPRIGGADQTVLPSQISISNANDAIWYALIAVGGLTILFATCLFLCSCRRGQKPVLQPASTLPRSLSRHGSQGPHVSLPRGLARPQPRTTSRKESRTQDPSLDEMGLQTATEFINANSGRKQFPVIRVHVKAAADEMNLVPGDRCVLLRVFPDGWAEGVSMRAGGPSIFPVICLGGSVPRVLAAKYNAAAPPPPRPYGRPMAPQPKGPLPYPPPQPMYPGAGPVMMPGRDPRYPPAPPPTPYGSALPTRSNTQMSNDSIGPPPSESDVPRVPSISPSISPSESISMRAVRMNPVDSRYVMNAPPMPVPPNTPQSQRAAGGLRTTTVKSQENLRKPNSKEGLRGQRSGERLNGQSSRENMGGPSSGPGAAVGRDAPTRTTQDVDVPQTGRYQTMASIYSDLNGPK
ncbi:hypothetical protein HDU85_004025 [Gaertneriomyces sp. JEL0708]|nr:hypothetical protein HDU85_004025 [Gaertneriomyces sp. JEL0708]